MRQHQTQAVINRLSHRILDRFTGELRRDKQSQRASEGRQPERIFCETALWMRHSRLATVCAALTWQNAGIGNELLIVPITDGMAGQIDGSLPDVPGVTEIRCEFARIPREWWQ
jgi:hypothetical protein